MTRAHKSRTSTNCPTFCPHPQGVIFIPLLTPRPCRLSTRRRGVAALKRYACVDILSAPTDRPDATGKVVTPWIDGRITEQIFFARFCHCRTICFAQDCHHLLSLPIDSSASAPLGSRAIFLHLNISEKPGRPRLTTTTSVASDDRTNEESTQENQYPICQIQHCLLDPCFRQSGIDANRARLLWSSQFWT